MRGKKESGGRGRIREREREWEGEREKEWEIGKRVRELKKERMKKISWERER